jgi:hypothetical protein
MCYHGSAAASELARTCEVSCAARRRPPVQPLRPQRGGQLLCWVGEMAGLVFIALEIGFLFMLFAKFALQREIEITERLVIVGE